MNHRLTQKIINSIRHLIVNVSAILTRYSMSRPIILSKNIKITFKEFYDLTIIIIWDKSMIYSIFPLTIRNLYNLKCLTKQSWKKKRVCLSWNYFFILCSVMHQFVTVCNWIIKIVHANENNIQTFSFLRIAWSSYIRNVQFKDSSTKICFSVICSEEYISLKQSIRF